MKEIISIIFVGVLIATLIGIGPVLTILSLNTLFSLTIPLNIWTWLSTLWLGIVLFPSKKFSRD